MKEKSGSNRGLRAAVVGGGIGGISAACSLCRRGVRSHFRAGQSARRDRGWLDIFPNGLRQLERMGLAKALAAVGAKIGDGSRYCRADGTVVGPIVTTNSTGWNGMYGMHRADLSNTLAAKLPPKTVRLGHCCTGIVQTASSADCNSRTATASKSTSSSLRTAYNQLAEVCHRVETFRVSGVAPIASLIPAEKLPDRPEAAHMVWMGDGKHFIVYPVRSGRLLNYVGFVPTKNETIESWSAVRRRQGAACLSMDGILKSSDCSIRCRLAIGGVSIIAVRSRHGQAGGWHC